MLSVLLWSNFNRLSLPAKRCHKQLFDTIRKEWRHTYHDVGILAKKLHKFFETPKTTSEAPVRQTTTHQWCTLDLLHCFEAVICTLQAYLDSWSNNCNLKTGIIL